MMSSCLYFWIITSLFIPMFGYTTVESGIYVSPSGNDRSLGSFSSPVKSLQYALELSRLNGEKKIFVRKGEYFNTSLNFLPCDSDMVISGYKGEVPILFGGYYTNSSIYEGKFVVLNLSGVRKRILDFRMIYVDGVMLTPCRLPRNGFFKYKNVWNEKTLPASNGLWKNKPVKEAYNGLIYTDSVVANIDPENAEIALTHSWNESYLALDRVDRDSHKLFFRIPPAYPLGAFLDQTNKANDYVVYNDESGANYPGSWYLNRNSEKLYYYPHSSEVLQPITFYIPSSRTILNFGNLGIKRFSINGVELRGCTNKMQDENFGAISVDAVISGAHLNRCSFRNVIINKSGGSAINLLGDFNVFENIHISNVFGGGLYIRGSNNHVSNTSISGVGKFFKSSVGIYEDGTLNSFNKITINDVSYTGISIRGNNTKVTNSVISDVMQSLNDGAAIYCAQGNNINLLNNAINGRSNSMIGVYLDEKSSGTIVDGNLIKNFQVPLHAHLAQRSEIRNNLFVSQTSQKIILQNSQNILFSSNLVIGKEVQIAKGQRVDNNESTLFLSNVFFVAYPPVGEALKYIKQNDQTRFKSNQNHIAVLSLSSIDKMNTAIKRSHGSILELIQQIISEYAKN